MAGGITEYAVELKGKTKLVQATTVEEIPELIRTLFHISGTFHIERYY